MIKRGGNIMNLDLCGTCRQCEANCHCARFPGYPIRRWEGPKVNIDLGKVDVLALGLFEALKPKAPLFKLVAVLRTFVELEPKRLGP